ncbi:Leucine-rich repeat, cysteine-containing subtype [Artemisia annua]|uniref:Leucine-rich repeat, cysteine-containing subtype n=1 Tax=Artemisia annua TaxID=35608 RepID=A0A2U1NL23_ARTAN|nr:Leucine-rich repeat, cysteine-containing subtype [Artemisia annua]
MKLIVESCPNIKYLNLSYYNHEVGKLEFDDVGLCAIADACVNLFDVDLYDCVNVTDRSLKVIAEATCLERLYLAECFLITDVGLEYLANGDLKFCLKTLLLRKCDRITDNAIIHLKKLVSLTTLDLSECDNATDYGVVALCELPNIKALELNYLFNIMDISLLEIARKCLNLSLISLNGCNRITGVGLHAFSGHQCLVRILLHSCYNISWEDVKSIALTCPSLRLLHLSSTLKQQMSRPDYEYIGNRFTVSWE